MKKIINLRKKIDTIDKKLISVLAERKTVTDNIGTLKKNQRLKAKDSKREEEMLLNRKVWAERKNIDPNLIISVFEQILKNSVKNHKKIMEKK